MNNEKSTALLEGILETLKAINTGLQGQEKKWEWLEVRQASKEDEEIIQQSEVDDKLPGEGDKDRFIPPTWFSSPDQAIFVDRAKIPPLEEGDIEHPDDKLILEEATVPGVSTAGPVQILSPDLVIEETPFVPQTSASRPPSVVDSLADIQESNAWAIESKAKKVSLINYLSWRSSLADSPLHQNEAVRGVLGDAWMIV
jgi:hypothetical protein